MLASGRGGVYSTDMLFESEENGVDGEKPA